MNATRAAHAAALHHPARVQASATTKAAPKQKRARKRPAGGAALPLLLGLVLAVLPSCASWAGFPRVGCSIGDDPAPATTQRVLPATLYRESAAPAAAAATQRVEIDVLVNGQPARASGAQLRAAQAEAPAGGCTCTPDFPPK